MLAESGISRQEQAANPQAVVDIVAFYQVCLRSALYRCCRSLRCHTGRNKEGGPPLLVPRMMPSGRSWQRPCLQAGHLRTLCVLLFRLLLS